MSRYKNDMSKTGRKLRYEGLVRENKGKSAEELTAGMSRTDNSGLAKAKRGLSNRGAQIEAATGGKPKRRKMTDAHKKNGSSNGNFGDS